MPKKKEQIETSIVSRPRTVCAILKHTLYNENSQFGPKNGAEAGESRMVMFLGPIQPHGDEAVLVPK